MTMLKTIVLLTVVTHALSEVDVCVDYSRDDFCSVYNSYCSYENVFKPCRVTCKKCTQPGPVASSLSLKNDCLGIINAKRRLHQNTPDLMWDGVIEAQAQAVVNDIAQSHNFRFGTNNYYGKVLFTYSTYGDIPSNAEICQMAVSRWYLNGENYDYSVAPSTWASYAFTQMIWKSTTKVGLGIARATYDNRNYFYVAAFFYKASNHDYTTNVMPLKTTTASATTPAPPLSVTTQPPPTTTKVATTQPPPTTTKAITTQPPPTTTKATTTQVSGSNSHESSCLPFHNMYRARHVNTPSLVYDASIENVAQAYAEYLAKNDLFEHNPNLRNYGYGENLYWSSRTNGDKADCEAAIKAWYDEIKDYDYNNPGFSSGVIGHFTQVVWSSTTRLGVGIARTSNGATYVVANYAPPGNYVGQYGSYVKPLKT